MFPPLFHYSQLLFAIFFKNKKFVDTLQKISIESCHVCLDIANVKNIFQIHGQEATMFPNLRLL
jgi:hypothetical protein